MDSYTILVVFLLDKRVFYIQVGNWLYVDQALFGWNLGSESGMCKTNPQIALKIV